MATTSSTPPPDGIARASTPPPHTVMSQRAIVPVHFEGLKPKEVRSLSNTITWNSDGKKLLSVGFEKYIRGWPLDNFEERSTFQLSAPTMTEPVTAIEGHPRHPDLLCAASERDKKIAFFDFRARAATRVIEVGTAVRSIQFNADGQIVLLREGPSNSGSSNSSSNGSEALSLFDVRSGQQMIQKSARDLNLGYDIRDARFNHSRELIYASGNTGAFTVLDAPSLEPLHRIRRANITDCRTIGVDPRGRFVATGGGDALVNIWETQDWIGLRSIENAESTVVNTAFSNDGEWLACLCDTGYIDIVEAETGLHESRISQRFTPKSIAWHPSQTILATAGGDRRSEAWISLIGG